MPIEMIPLLGVRSVRKPLLSRIKFIKSIYKCRVITITSILSYITLNSYGKNKNSINSFQILRHL